MLFEPILIWLNWVDDRFHNKSGSLSPVMSHNCLGLKYIVFRRKIRDKHFFFLRNIFCCCEIRVTWIFRWIMLKRLSKISSKSRIFGKNIHNLLLFTASRSEIYILSNSFKKLQNILKLPKWRTIFEWIK